MPLCVFWYISGQSVASVGRRFNFAVIECDSLITKGRMRGLISTPRAAGSAQDYSGNRYLVQFSTELPAECRRKKALICTKGCFKAILHEAVVNNILQPSRFLIHNLPPPALPPPEKFQQESKTFTRKRATIMSA